MRRSAHEAAPRGAHPGPLRRGRRVGAALAALLGLAGAAAAATPALPERLTAAAAAFLASLAPAQRASASFPFDDAERFDLRLIPFFLDGLRMSRLEEAQEAKLRDLLATALSAEGLRKVETIMSLEDEVARLERQSLLRWPVHFFRHPKRYHVAVFGEPSNESPWGFRFDGHHVSLNVTVAPGATPSATPLFLGAQPREVPAGFERAGLRALAEEEEIARRLYLSLEGAARERATVPFASGRGLFLGAGRRVALEGAPSGLPRGEMPEAARRELDALLEVYLGLLAPEIAAARRSALDAAGRDAIRFAWAGGTAAGEPSYYRIQGPSFLIEFDNSLDGADHVHAIWRDFSGDFGEDLLARHYAQDHGAEEGEAPQR